MVHTLNTITEFLPKKMNNMSISKVYLTIKYFFCNTKMKKSIFIFTISLFAMASSAIAQSLSDAQRQMRNEQFEDAESTLKR